MKISIIVLLVFGFLFTFSGWALHFWKGETLTPTQVCKKWGDEKFLADKFKNGDTSLRSKMACSILKEHKNFVGKDRSDIRKELGDFDGFYFSDMFPTYIIESTDKESWQIVFLLDRKESVSGVIVHKNCCE